MKGLDTLDFAKTRVVETSGEEFLGERLIRYNQLHLAVSTSGEDYRERAKEEIAKKAMLKGCEFAVDLRSFLDMDDSVILVATGLRNNSLQRDEAALLGCTSGFINRYLERNASHLPANSFLGRMRKNPGDYSFENLRVLYPGQYGEDNLGNAEFHLAHEAIRKRCEFVTGISYRQNNQETGWIEITAKGLVKQGQVL
jgi:hypothetical protein